MKKRILLKGRLSPYQIIISGFAGAILLGALLLTLPLSSQSGLATPFNDALFTTVSAVCVTGLVVRDTASYWSGFGQAVILALIQIGGLGVVTVAAAAALLTGKKISLSQRSTLQEAIAAPKVGGIVRLTGFILKAIFIFEFFGALLLLPVFWRDFGAKGVWLACFHSVSACCNAGFDLLGSPALPYPSLTGYIASPALNLAIMPLIIIGGLGFHTWQDIYIHRLRIRRYCMQTKVVLLTTALLILLPALLFFLVDFAALPLKERLLASLFQSVTTRTAGFNTAELAAMTGASQAIIVCLMLVGGSPGSTAGGMKTTTFAVLAANLLAVCRRKNEVEAFGRRIDNSVVRNAAAILMLYITLFGTGAVIISLAEQLPLGVCLYETASALGTVGLTLGITPQLGILSQCVLMSLMFLGRVGGLTFILAATSRTNQNIVKLPQERITVG